MTPIDDGRQEPFFSVVVPVYNGGEVLASCLSAIRASSFDDLELIVVDDGSADDSAEVAERFGARVLETGRRRGPAAARNLGAREAVGRYLLFIDADCEPDSRTLGLLADELSADPRADAVFGSYDDAPTARGFVSQYKNLQHHWVHQSGGAEAETFWSGCGAVRRSVFEEVGGFDERRYPRPSIEDIELGYRIRRAGYSIRLAPSVQVKHHKNWGFFELVRTDVLRRGVPWTELMLEHRELANDLNLSTASRVSALASVALLFSLVAALFDVRWLLLSAAAAGALLALNRGFYDFLRRKRGFWFVVRAIPLHWLYYIESALAFALGCLRVLFAGRGPGEPPSG